MMSDFCATVLMLDVTRRAERLAPHVTFEILSNNVEDPWEALDRADVDALVMPANLLPPEHPQEMLFEDNFVCIAWTGNDAVGETLALEQYLDLGHVTCQFNRGRTPMADEVVPATPRAFAPHRSRYDDVQRCATARREHAPDRHDPRPARKVLREYPADPAAQVTRRVPRGR